MVNSLRNTFLIILYFLIIEQVYCNIKSENPKKLFITQEISKSDNDNYISFISPYLVIFDVNGYPIFKREVHRNSENFKMHSPGLFTYYDNSIDCFIVLDSTLTVTDTINMNGGYQIDYHDIKIDENLNLYLLGYEYESKDLSNIIQGGQTNATVVGSVIQILDKDKNLKFEWKSLEHIDIRDVCDNYADLTSNFIDPFHANSIAYDVDKNIYISARNLNEVIKINESGEIIWRLGGKHNEFNLINDEYFFSGQHSINILNDSMISLFDNGNTFHPEYSRGVMYRIDQSNKTIELLSEYRITPNVYAPVMGNINHAEDGNIIIGWGRNNDSLLYTEYDKHDNLVKTVFLDSFPYYSYAVNKINWNHNIFSSSVNMVEFDTIHYGEIGSYQISIKNNTENTLNLTDFHSTNKSFSVIEEFPIFIQPNSIVNVTLNFSPDEYGGEFKGYIYINSKSNLPQQEQISVPIHILGFSPDIFSPQVAVYPENNSFDISIDTNITVKSNEPIRMLDDSDITEENVNNFIHLLKGGLSGENVPYQVFVNQAMTDIVISPDALEDNTEYCIVVDDLIEDYSDNKIESVESCFRTETIIGKDDVDNRKCVFYPNPSDRKIIVLFTNGYVKKVELINNTGIVIGSNNIERNMDRIELDILNKGMYFIRIIYRNNEVQTQKILII